jgi:hypothetical protein
MDVPTTLIPEMDDVLITELPCVARKPPSRICQTAIRYVAGTDRSVFQR